MLTQLCIFLLQYATCVPRGIVPRKYSRLSAGQQIPSPVELEGSLLHLHEQIFFLLKPKVHYCIFENPLMDWVLNHMNRVPTCTHAHAHSLGLLTLTQKVMKICLFNSRKNLNINYQNITKIHIYIYYMYTYISIYSIQNRASTAQKKVCASHNSANPVSSPF